MNMKIAFVTPTKDRPDDIRMMLRGLEQQTRRPDQVIVVDASQDPVESIVDEFLSLQILYIRWDGDPSAAAQRNRGASVVADEIDLVCFFDDDQVLYPDAVDLMLAYWKCAPSDQGATSFNLGNYEARRWGWLKASRLIEMLGIYNQEPGTVARSGWQSLYGAPDVDLDVDWLSSQALVLRKSILKDSRFDEFFQGYSYLEDLDFSFGLSRQHRLTVVASARFDHFHSPSGRINHYRFGVVEVRNRRYIVRKYGMSMAAYRMAMSLRWIMTIVGAIREPRLIGRAYGNLVAAIRRGDEPEG